MLNSYDMHFIDAKQFTANSLVGQVRDALAERHVALLSNFSGGTRRFIDFISEFGVPVEYYGDTNGAHPEHGAIHRVLYEKAASARGELHAVDGPLDVHSAQSLREPRPRFFCMFMVNSGWQDQAIGSNGESILAPWSRAFELMATQYPQDYERICATLLSKVSFPDGKRRTVAYHLQDQNGEFDLGVRLKYDLVDYLQTLGADSVGTVAVSLLSAAARQVAWRGQLQSGNLVLLDNDRWAHGRHPLTGQRTAGGQTECNPRELWSVTLA